MSAVLPRLLRFRDLSLLTLGVAIGSGIFVVPAAVLRLTGGQLSLAIVVWVAGGALSIMGALTYGELGAMKPEAGGLYVYIRDAFGSFAAFLYGWTVFLVVSSATNAALGMAFAGYLAQFVTLTPLAAKVVAIAMIAAVALINIVGTRQSATVQNVGTAIKVASIVLFSVLLLYSGEGNFQTPAAGKPLEGSLLAGMGIALVSVLWAYEGWQWVTFSAGETEEPHRTFAPAILVGTVALVALYVLANVGYVAALGPERAALSTHIASDAVATVFGTGAARLVAFAILIAIFTSAQATIMTTSRVYFAMARDGLFFKCLADVHPRLRTPVFSILVGSIWSATLAALGTFDALLTYVVFVGWLFYGLAAAALFYYRKTEPRTTRPFRVPGYPWTPLLFIFSAAALVVNTLIEQPGDASVGLGIVLLGAPAYVFWKARTRRAAQTMSSI